MMRVLTRIFVLALMAGVMVGQAKAQGLNLSNGSIPPDASMLMGCPFEPLDKFRPWALA